MRTRRLLAPTLAALALGAPLAACGSLEGDTSDPPTLATLKGDIAVDPSAMPPSGAIRVAVVWRGLLSGQYDVAEDLPVSALTFPASFQIELDVPPPASAMMSGEEVVQLFEPELLEGPPTDCMVGMPCDAPEAGPAPKLDFQVAGGVVVAYLDKNGNGKLDLVPTGADAYVDEIIGTNEDLWVVYFQGSLPSAGVLDAEGTPTLGYNLYRHNDCTGESVALPNAPDGGMTPMSSLDAAPASDASIQGLPDGGPHAAADAGGSITIGADAGGCRTNDFLPFTTPYTLTVSGHSQGSSLMCEVPQNTVYKNTIEPSGAVPPGGYPSSGAPGFACGPIGDGPDDGSYTLTTCSRPTTGLCEQNVCVVDQYPQPSPLPAGWPCSALEGVPIGGNGAK